ncbi:hypothetical protein [Kitasatospora sp. KL5]|uniref:hypothetical protein n=1 Tax=Kitasatospora sp. KL5 TaxID=3425125 RepID=UPI003D6FA3C9
MTTSAFMAFIRLLPETKRFRPGRLAAGWRTRISVALNYLDGPVIAFGHGRGVRPFFLYERW